jgi:deoxyribose-phosphate aldolase
MVCIQPCFVSFCREIFSIHQEQDTQICTVIGFPNGYNETKIKVEETKLALKQGATEIDMVINVCRIKDGDWNYVEKEICEIVKVCLNQACVKVIIEASLLTKKEIIGACHVCTRANVQYVKTSTGFNGKALIEDVRVMRDNVPNWMKIKAAGGIRSLEKAEQFLNLGVSRLGTSSGIRLMKEINKHLDVSR